MYELCRIFEHVIDGLYDAPLAQHDFVPHRHELVLHIASDTRDQVYAVLEEHVEELGRDVSPVGKQLTVEPFCQNSPHLWIPVVHMGTCETEGYDFPPVVADEVQLETVTPSHRSLSVSGQPLEHFVGITSQVVAYGNHRGVHETDARTATEGGEVEEEHHLEVPPAPERSGLPPEHLRSARSEEHPALQLYEAVVRHGIGEIRPQVLPDIEQVVVLEVAERTVHHQ